MTSSRPLSPVLAWIAAIIVVLAATVFVRLYPLRSNMWSDSQQKASLVVIMKLKASLREQIIRSNPGISAENAERLADEQLNGAIKKDKARFRETIERLSGTLHEQDHPDDTTIYLLESDPFYYYNLTNNVLRDGKLSDTVKGSKYFNHLMGAPFGLWQPFNILPYLGAGLYLLIKIFNPAISVMAAVSFLPIIVSVLAVLAFFWAGWALSLSAAATGAGALFLSLASVVLKRSSLGWYDTDPFNMLFPTILFVLMAKSLSPQKGAKNFIWALTFVATITLYSLLWHGWGFVLAIALGAVILTALWHRIFLVKAERPPFLRVSGIFLVGSIIGISLVFGGKEFFVLIKEGLEALKDFGKGQLSLWPDLFIAVGELKRSSLQGMAESVGNPLLLAASFAGTAMAAWSLFRDKASSRTNTILCLFVFWAVTVVLNLRAERFAILSVVPLALFFAFCIDGLILTASRTALLKKCLAPAAFIVLSWMIFSVGEHSVRATLTPIFNATWEKALLDIKAKTPADTVVNTWWPPGHFIKGIAERRVPFDGASLDKGETGYWMANILLSSDEDQAAGLIRMLNSSGNRAVEFLTGIGLRTSQAIALIKKIAPLSRQDAALVLKDVLRAKDAETLLGFTHGQNPHSVVLLYNEIMEDNILLSFNGNWDVEKIEKINGDLALQKAIPPRTSSNYIPFLWTISGGMPRFGPALRFMGIKDGIMTFQDNVLIDPKTPAVRVASKTFGSGIPRSLVWLKDGHVVEENLAGSTLSYSVLLYEEDGRPVCRMMDRSIINSLWVKLYFFDGKGLNRFKPLTETRDLTGQTRIKVFTVAW